MRAFAESAAAILDVLQRLLLWAALALLLLAPGRLPLLDRFVIETTEINLFGQKFKISDTRGSAEEPRVPGLVIRDGRVLLNGEDLNALPAERDRLQSELDLQGREVVRLRQENTTLADRLRDASEQLAQLAAAGSLPQATQSTLAGLAEAARSAAAGAQGSAAAPRPPPSTTAARPPAPMDAYFAVVVGADTSLAAAADEVRKAASWAARQTPPRPVRVYRRSGAFHTTVLFDSSQSALAALPALRAATRSDAYIADLRSWCPAALATTPRIERDIAVSDCRF